jgi:aspartyl-tRNA(Asn)/glutamyl-tRNA(Gln) amidotransferase subunit C
MTLSEQDVRYVAELAHLALTSDEMRKLLPQLDSILQYMQKLNALDTTQVEPIAQVTYRAGENPSLRSDQAWKGLARDEALRNAPEPCDGYFKVPRVIEKD